MRNEGFLIAGAAAALMATACDNASSITGPQLAPPGKPAADVVSDRFNEQDIPFGFVDVNPCTGEAVALNGSMHVMMETLFDEGGGFHVSASFSFKATGVGLSGIAYTASD